MCMEMHTVLLSYVIEIDVQCAYWMRAKQTMPLSSIPMKWALMHA